MVISPVSSSNKDLNEGKTVIFLRRHHVGQLAEVSPFRISSGPAVIRSGDGLFAGLCTHDNSSGKIDNTSFGESADLCIS